MNYHFRRGALALCATTAMGLGLVACGSDEGGGGAANAGLTKDPVKLWVIGDETSQTGLSYSGIPAAIKAAAERVNKEGGIEGHPVEIKTCDLQNLPDQASRCARDALNDKASAALVQASFGTAKIPPVFEQGKTAYLPAFAFDPADLHSDVAFPMAAGVLTQIAGSYIAGLNCQNPVLISVQTPQLDYVKELSAMGFAAAGKPPAKIVAAPLGATDWAPTAAQAVSSKPDCIVPYLSETLMTAFYPALQQTGWKNDSNKLAGYQGGVYTQKILEKFPDLLEGMVAVDMSYPFNDPKWNKFNETMDPINKEKLTNFTSSFTKGSYLNFLAFVDVARRVAKSGQPVNNESVLAMFNKTSDVQTDGLLAPVDTSTPWSVEDFPRMFNRSLVFETFKDGKLTALENGKFNDLSDKIAQASAQ
ncbi:ABC transporter substrate-binding protein [Solirubrobacter sp. CPCC 204708]|uniref:ABC transporter substrate-binding protein n=1 Tax=Solirubrobacter deserti TaxID=2282478 RepID=A0ABT4RG01_9ACTN|nr:ABC transporter substrate-binding protein [Solirubrobacter deserti]MBE2318188.1 ABC transporter substrate-binding protein [Solirubrobacter deserti]MDA0137469.1 ABC transporter substrate-binding protein [Solirubrobacter deserti]